MTGIAIRPGLVRLEGVFTELSEIVDPAHTALVLVDMQRDFCLPGGAFGSLDVDLSMYPTAIEKMVDLLACARQALCRSSSR